MSVPCTAAITVGHVDDFQDGTVQHWRIGQPSSFPKNIADAGPQGVGDRALFTSNSQPGARPLLIVLNDMSTEFPGPGNWEGNWTAAGVRQISLDVRNPGTVMGASNLTLRLGIAGPGGTNAFGDVYITQGFVVPPDNQWHSLTYDVRPQDFTAVGIGSDVAAALAAVTQFRIFSNPLAEFIGSTMPNEFYLDNIRALGAAARVPGDYSGNGTVDAADYTLWRDTLGQAVAPGSGADGSGPGGTPDGMINTLDYDFWRARFGNSAAGNVASHPADAPVPEPHAWLLMTGLFAAKIRWGRRHALAPNRGTIKSTFGYAGHLPFCATPCL